MQYWEAYMRIFIASTPDELREALTGFRRTATVEAEYGDVTVPGTVCTLAHHGKNADNPAPCALENGVYTGIEAVGVSHVDLDTLGGVLALDGSKPFAPKFWELAEFVDLNGPHQIQEDQWPAEVLAAWWAYRAVARAHYIKASPPREITSELFELATVLTDVLMGSPALLDQGTAFRESERAMETRSFIARRGRLVLRACRAHEFVNHMYRGSDSQPAAVLSLKPVSEGGPLCLTLSFSGPGRGLNAREILQDYFGPSAGGHDLIAGSPREGGVTREDVADIIRLLDEDLGYPEGIGGVDTIVEEMWEAASRR